MLVELRTGTASNSKVDERAEFIKSDGTIVDLDGTSPVTFTGLGANNYYVVVRHRNHLAIMTASAIPLSSSSTDYDFTTAQSQAFGINPLSDLGGGVFGMIAGDGNGDGGVTIVDRNLVWRVQNGTIGYLPGDFDLNSGVSIVDRNLKWRVNNGKLSQVPN